jgi:uncharacterized protein
METVLITGASGLIGRHLKVYLERSGFRVLTFSRSRSNSSPNSFHWNPKTGKLDLEALIQTDHIVHLAGASIGEKRWTPERKQEILDSRIHTARMLLDAVIEQKVIIKTFISASAIGYYQYGDNVHTEEDLNGESFLSRVCKHWESIADEFESHGIRSVKIRTGLVLSPNGGVLNQLMQPVRLGFGMPFGSGKQGFSWIQVEDLCKIYAFAIENSNMRGAYNAVAPEMLNNKTFMMALSRHLRKPFWNIRIPEFAFRWLLGERSELIVKGHFVLPKRLQDEMFTFNYYEVGAALESVIEQP